MAWYRTGTVAVTAGSPNVVGTGTLWTSYLKDSDGIVLPDGRVYEILDVVDNTHLTLATNYAGSTASAQAYQAWPTHAFSIQLAAAVSQLYTDFSSYLTTALAGRFDDGTSSAPGVSFASDADTGFYRYGTNTIGVSVGGSLRARFSSAGISLDGAAAVTTAPVYGAYGLQVQGPGGTGNYSPPITFDVGGGGGRAAIYTQHRGSAGGRLIIATENTSSAMTEAIRIDESQRVGIGESAPDVKLRIKGSNVANKGQLLIDADDFAQISMYNAATRKAALYMDTSQAAAGDLILGNYTTNGNVVFGAGGGAERVRIDKDGNHVVGGLAADSIQIAGSASTLRSQVWGLSGGTSGLLVGRHAGTNAAAAPASALARSRGTAYGSPVAVASNDVLGYTTYHGYDGGAYRESVRWTAYAVGTISSGVVPGQLTLSLANTSGVVTQTAAWLADGQYLLGTTSGWSGHVSRQTIGYVGGGTEYGLTLATNNTGSSRAINFLYTTAANGGGTVTAVGNITSTTTGVAFNNTSDRRAKENIAPAAAASPVLAAIEVVQHDWKVDGSHMDFNTIAQDLHEVLPVAVTPGDDGPEIERAWGVDPSKAVWLLVKGWQEQQAVIEALKARVANLEGGDA